MDHSSYHQNLAIQFLKSNDVKHIKSAPYHPSTNAIAECFVQSFKRAMLINESLPIEQRFANFLIQCRTTVHATTNPTPCMLLMNRQLRTRLDLLRPNIEVQVSNKQANQKINIAEIKNSWLDKELWFII